MPNNLIYIDIETIPTSRTDVIERIAREIAPPATTTTEAGREKWMLEKSADAIEKQHHDTGFDGGLGELACVSVAQGTGDVVSFSRREDCGESQLLRDLYAWLAAAQESVHRYPLCFVGHNVQFDLTFLHKRGVVLRLPPPVPWNHDAPPWKDGYIDTQQLWWGNRPGKGSSLARLCEALSVEHDDAIDGSQVWAAWLDGRIDEIVEHCEADVRRVRDCHRRITFQG